MNNLSLFVNLRPHPNGGIASSILPLKPNNYIPFGPNEIWGEAYQSQSEEEAIDQIFKSLDEQGIKAYFSACSWILE
jgi:hypothetical protein